MMIDLILAMGFAVLGIMIALMVMSPDHVTRDDNPITGRLVGAALALVCFSAAGAFLEAWLT